MTHRFRVTSGDWRGAYQHDRLRGQLPVALHRALAGGGPEFVIELGDDLDSDPPTRVVLRLRLQDWIAGDEIRVLWDGKPVALDIAYDFGNDPAPIADVSAATWHSCELAPLQAQQGAHQIAVSLVARHPQLACDLVLTDIEVLVRY